MSSLNKITSLTAYKKKNYVQPNEIKPLKSLKRKIKKIEFDSNQQSTLDTFFN